MFDPCLDEMLQSLSAMEWDIYVRDWLISEGIGGTARWAGPAVLNQYSRYLHSQYISPARLAPAGHNSAVQASIRNLNHFRGNPTWQQLGRFGTVAASPVIFTGVDYWTDRNNPDISQERANANIPANIATNAGIAASAWGGSKVAGVAAGAAASTWAGSKAGGAAGTVFSPIVGTAIGAAGGAIGGLGGYLVLDVATFGNYTFRGHMQNISHWLQESRVCPDCGGCV